ncbi:immunoglobulin domain-containing protein [Prosthecobacter sp. SYSU 5D2]|uniref:immunoglobulin domain-containing protein n=1 Tax=Prosthecobacter sp. SYSU 5D2 TaxID=3134134 RepID=UPI0031FEDDA1
MSFKAPFYSCIALLLAVTSGSVWAQVPRISVSQVGLHFICTADGQPDMYSWRNPVPDYSDWGPDGNYKIPNFDPLDPGVSGGRTALKVNENIAQEFAIEHIYPEDFGGLNSRFRLTNLQQIHWSTAEEASSGRMKARYYSNYPPLSNFQPGRYNTVATDSDDNFGRYYVRHPGYDFRNWNWTLPYDTPLHMNQKRIQAMLHLELRLPEGGSGEGDFNLSFVISGVDMSTIQVNGEQVFSRNTSLVVKTQKSLFLTSPSTELHTFADARRLVQGRRAPAVSNKPADAGYSDAPNSATMNLNLDLVSRYFTVSDHADLVFNSDLITIKIYDMHVAANTTEMPVQTVAFRLPMGRAPSPDLVVAGSGQVHYITPSGTAYRHPAIQAIRWWSFSRDGNVGRYEEGFPGQYDAIKGRFSEWRVAISNDRSAVNNLSFITNKQRVPGARALVYGYDASFYPDVGNVSVSELMTDPARRIEYQGPDYDRPVHYGTDTLRLLKNVNPLVARTHLSESEFEPEANYANPNLHMAEGFAEEQPRFALHPVSAVLERGEEVRLSVGVGNGPVTYQWRFKGEPIDGATNSSFLVTDMSPEKSGAYDVVATNGKGSTPSKPAILSVPGPVIILQPADIVANGGAEAVFTVTAEGDGLSYQWRRNRLVIDGANTSTLTLKKVKAADEGSYDVLVVNVDGRVVSEPAELRLKRSLAIIKQPVGGNLRVGGRVILQVQAVGEGAMNYRWRRNGEVVMNSTEDRLILTSVEGDNFGGMYDVVVTDESGSVTSQKVKVTDVGMPPMITLHPMNQTASMGGQATFSVQAQGGSLTYQWRLNGANVAKGKGASLVVSGVKEKNLGRYDCVVENEHGRTLSQMATLSLSSALSFTMLPENVTVAPGDEAAFTSEAAGEGLTPSYQWSFKGKEIPGAIYPDLVIPKASVSQAGLYSVTAISGADKVTTTVMLGILEPGVLVYKLSGTGVTTTGATPTRMALKGYLLVNRSEQPPQGTLLLVSKDGKYSRYQEQNLAGLRVDSTGPALKTQTAISAVTDETGEPPFRSQLWLQGADSVVKLSKTDQTLAPKTLSGSAHQLLIENETGEVTLETVSFKAAMDMASSARARQNRETLYETTARLTADLQVAGSVAAPDVEP